MTDTPVTVIPQWCGANGVTDIRKSMSSLTGGSAEMFETVYRMLVEEGMAALPETKILIMEPFVLQVRSTASSQEEPERWNYFYGKVYKRAEIARHITKQIALIAANHLLTGYRENAGFLQAWGSVGSDMRLIVYFMRRRGWLAAFRAPASYYIKALARVKKGVEVYW